MVQASLSRLQARFFAQSGPALRGDRANTLPDQAPTVPGTDEGTSQLSCAMRQRGFIGLLKEIGMTSNFSSFRVSLNLTL